MVGQSCPTDFSIRSRSILLSILTCSRIQRISLAYKAQIHQFVKDSRRITYSSQQERRWSNATFFKHSRARCFTTLTVLITMSRWNPYSLPNDIDQIEPWKWDDHYDMPRGLDCPSHPYPTRQLTSFRFRGIRREFPQPSMAQWCQDRGIIRNQLRRRRWAFSS